MVNIPISPGVIKDTSELAASRRRSQRRWKDSSRIRFVGGFPQKLGGWAKRFNTQFIGICRGLLGWIDNSDIARLAIGTHAKLYALEGETYVNITPIRATESLTNPFDTTSGSAIVTVNDTSHGANDQDYVEISGASAVGGITPDGNYQLTLVDDNTYTIEHSSSASSTVNGGGGSVTAKYEISIGRQEGAAGNGYGMDGYGTGTYGTVRSDFIVLDARTWSIDQWGQYLLAQVRGGNLYEWQLDNTARALVVSNAPTSNNAMFVTEEKHCVILGAGGDPMKVEWSDQDGNTVWTATDQNTAGGRRLVGGSKLLFGGRARRTNLIFSNTSVWSMTFLGGVGTGIFSFDQVAAGGSGIISPNAAAEIDGIFFWMGKNGFYMFDGVVRRIPNAEDIERFVLDNLAAVGDSQIYCVPNILFNEIWWFYATSGENSRYVKVNMKDWSWDVGALARTAGVDRDAFTLPIMTSDDRYLMDHESGTDDDGSAMNEFIESAPWDLADGETEMDIEQLWPDFHTITGTILVSMLTKPYPQGTELEENQSSITSSTETVDVRASGRQAAYKIQSTATGTHWRAGTLKLLLSPAGQR